MTPRAPVNRTLALWFPHWPVVAAGVTAETAAAVVRSGRVAAATPAALAEGVAIGQRRRHAHACCPELEILVADARREERLFDPLLRTVEELTPWIEVGAPGDCAIPVRGPARYFGGEEQFVERILATTATVLAEQDWPPITRVGVANGPNLARLVARNLTGTTRPAAIIPPGSQAAARAIAPVPVSALGEPELGEVLGVLGIGTLGSLAALDHSEVLGRFGPTGAVAHRLASGIDPHGILPGAPRHELTVRTELDPPAEHVETLAFAARSLATELQDLLSRQGCSAPRVVVTAETEHGERSERIWNSGTGALNSRLPGNASRDLADRIRWQMEGWLNGPTGQRPTGGVVVVQVTPDGTTPLAGTQLNLLDKPSATDEAVSKAVDRLEGILGEDSVRLPQVRGGRSPGEAVVRVSAHSGQQLQDGPRPPWPGAVPAPAPALIHDPPLPMEVLDAGGRRLEVGARGELSGTPRQVTWEGSSHSVVSWAGPWPADERWWADRRRRARMQLVLDDGAAVLATLEKGSWGCEATYD